VDPGCASRSPREAAAADGPAQGRGPVSSVSRLPPPRFRRRGDGAIVGGGWRVAGCGLRVAGCGLRAVGCGLRGGRSGGGGFNWFLGCHSGRSCLPRAPAPAR
jgi:hypothetical protein